MRIRDIMNASHTKLIIRRCATFLLCAALAGGMVSSALPALAVNENDTDNLATDGEADIDSIDDTDNIDDVDDTDSEDTYCEHHTEHTEECGYVEAVEGRPCTHEHDENCGYTETVEGQQCAHEHDEECGYVEAVEGQPCQFVCEICGGGSEELLQDVNTLTIDPMAASQDKSLIAHFSFDNSKNRLQDSSGKGVKAALYSVGDTDPDLGEVIGNTSDEWDQYFVETDDENEYALHLQNDACLVLQETKDFNNLTEITVEMRVKITEYQNTHWLFYAAPTNTHADATKTFMGAFISSDEKINIARSVYNSSNEIGNVEFLSAAGGYQYNDWHTIRAVYKHSSMALYIDEAKVLEKGAPQKTADYFGVGRVIWFGHSAWPDLHFKGDIDYIKIYNKAIYEPIDESVYIITEAVQDPPNTTVNMFDYWITRQTDNDYRPSLSKDTFIGSGINKNHLFLFAGIDGSTDATLFPKIDADIGAWNNFFTDEKAQHETYRKIVAKNLGRDGYPRLALDELKTTIPVALANRNMKESLAYLFKPSSSSGKAAYPNVTGLFRLRDDGYYYFNSAESYAELNTGESTRPKKSKSNNHITLYDKIWDPDNKDQDRLGQFFPFNDWSDLFYQPVVGDDMVQANNMNDQATTDEPMNHYLGMTVTTRFRQPTDGIIPPNSEEEEGQKMQFAFSGDDDVWVFIDDVLVGDLGGLHMRVRFNIDFSTGIIESKGKLSSDGTGGVDLQRTNEDLYDAFVQAGKVNKVKWKEVTVDGETHMVFADDSTHTLKFFYLERGNAASNCSISFNLYETEKVSTKKPSGPSGEDYPESVPTEEDQPVNISAQQPPEAKGEAKTTGVLASPNTGDSSMVVVWIILLVSSIMGIIALYRTRKRDNKQ